jgi:putative ABC transport system permease protein
MKYLWLVWAGLWRQPVRTILTLLSVATAFLLFGMLRGINYGYQAVIEAQRLDRLMTDPRVPGGPPMPISALAKIRTLPEVTRVCGRSLLFGQYQDRNNVIVGVATNVDDFFAVRPENEISAAHFARLKATRTGMAMPFNMAKSLGLELGDKVPLRTRVVRKDGSSVWEFDLVALFDDIDHPGNANFTVIHRDYLDESRVDNAGTVDRIIVRIADPTRSAQVAADIDQLFANSPHETRTQSEKEITESSIQQLGDISFFTNAVIGAVFFALLFVTGNTMMQSVRERAAELAVLSTIGYSERRILGLILAESMLLGMAAAAIGLLLAAAAFPLVRETLGIKTFSWIVVVAGLAVALVLALISAMLPAWQVRQMKIVDALR